MQKVNDNYSIPEFDGNGNLPPGFHRTTMENIRNKLTWSEKRKQLFAGLEEAIQNLRDAGVSQIYIDGSFATRKDEPNDIDGCWVPNTRIRMDLLDNVFLDMTNSNWKMKEKYGIDFGIAGVSKGIVSTQPLVECFERDEDGNGKGVLLLEF